MGHRCYIGNGGHFQTQRLDSPDSRFSARSWSFDIQCHFLQPHRHRSFNRLFSREPGRERSAFPRTLETRRTSAAPGNRIALSIGHCDNRIIESRKDMDLSR